MPKYMYWWRLALAASALGLCPAPPRLRAARRAPRRAAARMEYTSYGETKGPIKGVVAGLTAAVNFVAGGAPATLPSGASRDHPATAEALLAGLRADFEEREYLWSGRISPELYGDDCVFTDPTLSFAGLATFLRNLENLEPYIDRFAPASERKVTLFAIRLERERGGDDDGESDARPARVVAEWNMYSPIALPWRPRLDLNGTTAFTFEEAEGGGLAIARYDEQWAVPAARAVLQLLEPTPDAASVYTWWAWA